MSGNQQRPDMMCEVFILAPTDLVDDHEIPDDAPLPRRTPTDPRWTSCERHPVGTTSDARGCMRASAANSGDAVGTAGRNA
jgi:hypothetical protein